MAYYNLRYNTTDSYSDNWIQDWNCNNYNPLNYSPNIQILYPPSQSLIDDYKAHMKDCLMPVLKKIPNATEIEIEETLVGFVNIFERAILDISQALDIQNQTNLELKSMSEDALFFSKDSRILDGFVTREESQNQLNSLRDQLTKDFEDKIRVILEHEVHSDKSNTELLGLIFGGSEHSNIEKDT